MPYDWAFTIFPEDIYKSKRNYGFSTDELNEKYDDMMKTCVFMYAFWSEVTAGHKIINQIADNAERGGEKDFFKAAVVTHYTTHLAFLPQRTTFGSIGDLTSITAKAMKKLKEQNGLGAQLNDYDMGYKFWYTQNVNTLTKTWVPKD